MPRFSSWSSWLILVAITALAATLRLWQINESLWVDELHTSWCVHGSLSQVAERAAAGNQSPLFFWLVWGVTRLCGESELTVRLPSLLAGIALPGMTFVVVRRIGVEGKTQWGALLAALLVSIDHPSLFFATEARPYALVELVAAASLLLAIHVASRGEFWYRIALIAAHVALFYLHYSTALFITAQLGCLLGASFFQKHDRSIRWKTWCIDSGATLLLCLPALLQVLDIASRRGNWASFVGTNSLADLCTEFPFIFALVALIFLGRQPPSVRLLTTAATCAIPVLLAWALTFWNVAPLFHMRYLVATIPALWAAVATSTQLPDNQQLRSLATISIIAVALWWSSIIQNFLAEGTPLIDRQEDWRSAVAAAQYEHEQHPGWPILVHSGLIETNALREPHEEQLREYGLLPVRGLYSLTASDDGLAPLPMSAPGQLSTTVRQQVISAGGTTILLRRSAASLDDVEQDLYDSLSTAGARLEILNRNSFGNVQLITLRVHSR